MDEMQPVIEEEPLNTSHGNQDSEKAFAEFKQNQIKVKRPMSSSVYRKRAHNTNLKYNTNSNANLQKSNMSSKKFNFSDEGETEAEFIRTLDKKADEAIVKKRKIS